LDFLIWFASIFFPIGEWGRALITHTSGVENCNKALGPVVPDLDFSGVYAGVVVDDTQGGAEVQVKLVRDGNEVKGSYLRAGICGTMSGEVLGNRMSFKWTWADNSGRGTAIQVGNRLSGTSGFKDEITGAGKLEIFLKKQPEN